jgi:Uma2 family endonuclease
VAIEARVHRLSTAEYARMVDSGALDGLRIELLDGLLVDVSPQGERHARAVQRLMRLCSDRMDLLRVQMPLAVAEGWAPEPDISLADPHPDPDRHPSTALLVVEVAVTSQAEDRRKAPVYARADIPRYWLVDLRDRVVIEHTVPGPDGYGAVAERSGDDILDANVPGIKPTTVAKLLALATR